MYIHAPSNRMNNKRIWRVVLGIESSLEQWINMQSENRDKSTKYLYYHIEWTKFYCVKHNWVVEDDSFKAYIHVETELPWNIYLILII